MTLAFLIIAIGIVIGNLAFAWDVDSRCTRRRELEGFRFDLNDAERRHNTKISAKNLRGPLDGPFEDGTLYGSVVFTRSDMIEAEWRHDTKVSEKNRRAPLDGSSEVNDVHESHVEVAEAAAGQAVDIHRELQSTVFQMKMYWEEGYCWQEEWKERKWCLECQGGSCGEDDYLLIQTCSDSSKQQFIYEGERLKPFTRPDLCWERTGRNARQLKKCSSSSDQIIKGPKFNGNFEMHPNGYPDDCLTNPHHPKSGEIIRGQSCSLARNDKTSLWIMINKDGSAGGDDDVDNGGTGNASDRGREYCDTTICGLCEGDCDSDDQCDGTYECFQRSSGDPLPPGCSGLPLDSSTDFCYDPNGGAGGGAGGGNFKADDKGTEYCDISSCDLCEGDCDSDDQCKGTYKCYQRSSGDALPRGCSGVSLGSNTDFCYDPAA